MNVYAGGKRFEDKSRDALRADGYVVTRAAGSKGAMDLVALKPGQLLFVQCKGGQPRFDPEPWDRLVELAGWVGAVPVLACNGLRGRGVTWWRLTGRKQRNRPFEAQPVERFLPDEVSG